MGEDVRIGTVLSERYRIDALIGEGGMGRVYSAEHVMMKKRLAVKVLRRELTTVPDVVARFEREAMAAANIDHPNVAAATDFGKLSDGSVFLVLEFVSGASLRDEIAEGPMALERALHITRQIAAGLGSAHVQGIVHRDLKPENVMLVERGGDKDFVKVLDFGIAKVPIGEIAQSGPKDHLITKAGMVFGTPEYMSPEQALGQTVDGRADLYSLGVMLFEMLAGSRPFSSANPVGILGQQLANPPPTFAERAPDAHVPPAVEQIVQRLMARDREQRFNRASELVSVLDALLAPAPRDLARELLPVKAGGLTQQPVPEAQPETPPARDAAPHGLRAAFSSVFPPGEALRDRLPPRLRESLRPVSTRSLLLAGGAFALLISGLLVAVTVAVIRSLSRSEPPPRLAVASAAPVVTVSAPPSASARVAAVTSAAPVVQRASVTEVDAATKQGPAALEALASKYPLDARPLVEAARAWATAKDYVRATGAVGRALAVDAQLSRDDRLAAVLFQSAQSRASADAAFALLEGPMGARGAEIQWDLAGEPAVKPWVRQRAGQWLRSADFRRAAPPSLGLAAELRTASSCDAAHALLARAKQVGDERSLSQLEAWQSTTGCGKKHTDDCMPCLRKDSALSDAIAAIKARPRAR
jgi:serine/threonine protein kinase